MSAKKERQAGKLLEEYIHAVRSGRSVDVEALLRRCPNSERESLRDAIDGFDFIRSNYPPFLVTSDLVERTRSRILALKERRERLAQARARLQQHPWRGVLTSERIPHCLQTILGISLTAEDLGPRERMPAPAVQYRAAHPERAGAARAKATLEVAARQASAQALRVWRNAGSPGPPIDPKTIAENLGILVIEEGTEGCDGCIVMQGDIAAIVVNAAIRHEGRRRFTLAHEIGHFEMDRAWLQFLHESLRDMDCGWTDETEIAANSFASELLMPTDLVSPEFAHQEPSFGTIDAMAERYVVSKTAAARRLVEISDFACALLCIADGKIKWFTKSEYFPYFVVVGGPPHPDSVAAALCNGEQAPDNYGPSQAAWWAPEDRRAEDAELLEHSRLIYDEYVLTLLYAKEITR